MTTAEKKMQERIRRNIAEAEAEGHEKKLSEMTDKEVFEAANEDRNEGLGQYGLTAAMLEERKRLANTSSDPINQTHCQMFDE